MHLSCPQCGAGFEDDAAALRRRLTWCGACHAVFRLDPSGLVAFTGDMSRTLRPDGVEVEDSKDKLSIVVRRPKKQFVITKRELTAGAVFATVLTFGLFAAFDANVPALVVWGIGFVVAAVVTGALHERLPPVRISGDKLVPSTGFVGQLSTGDIKQLYTSIARITHPTGETIESCSVYALMQSGERKLVAGPVDSPESALYVEELLELRMRLFDRAVHGESAQSPAQQHRAPPPAEPPKVQIVESRSCVSCGAALEIDEATRRRGVATCNYCFTLTLLQRIDGAETLLGIDPSQPERIVHDVAHSPGGTVEIAPRKGERPMLHDGAPAKLAFAFLLSKVGIGAIVVAVLVGASVPDGEEVYVAAICLAVLAALVYLAFARLSNKSTVVVEKTGIRVVGRPLRAPAVLRIRTGAIAAIRARKQKPAGALEVLSALGQAASKTMARSGHIDARNAAWLEEHGPTAYEVVVQTREGRELPLVRDMSSPAEAAAIAQTLSSTVGLSS